MSKKSRRTPQERVAARLTRSKAELDLRDARDARRAERADKRDWANSTSQEILDDIQRAARW